MLMLQQAYQGPPKRSLYICIYTYMYLKKCISIFFPPTETVEKQLRPNS